MISSKIRPKLNKPLKNKTPIRIASKILRKGSDSKESTTPYKEWLKINIDTHSKKESNSKSISVNGMKEDDYGSKASHNRRYSRNDKDKQQRTALSKKIKQNKHDAQEIYFNDQEMKTVNKSCSSNSMFVGSKDSAKRSNIKKIIDSRSSIKLPLLK